MSCCGSCARGGACEGSSSSSALVVGARGGLASGAPREVRMVDDVLSSVWDSVRSVVPYGNVIDQAHQARRRLMYGDSATSTPARAPARAPARRAPPRSSSAGGNPTVRMLQTTVRAASRGDAAAAETLAAWKRAARSSPAMAKRWAAAVAVMRDDARRIERRTVARGVRA